jgi:phosphonate transport system substrate-binding protein
VVRRLCICVIAAGLALGLGGCGGEKRGYEPEFSSREAGRASYTFAVHPLHNPALLHRTYGPLIDYLNRHVEGARFRLVASRDYPSFNRRMAEREFDFALPNPYQALEAAHAGYRIFGKVGGDEGFRGMILVRRDSPIESVADLRGKTISYPAATAVAATMLPQYFIRSHGVRLEETRTLYVGSMESAIRSVGSGASDAATTWPDPWEKYVRSNPAEAAKLEVKWVTPPLVNNALVVRQSLPPQIAARVLRALEALPRTREGRRMLASMSIQSFEPATEATYAPVKRFLADFAATVRPLPTFAESAS